MKSQKIKNGLTEVVFILDRSGSMAGLEGDTIGGFNSTIEKQKKLDGRVIVSTVLFNDETSVIHDRVDVEEVQLLSEKDYQVGGTTALLDAIGGVIHHVGNVHKYARREDVPEHTVFIITTDGHENSSKGYTAKRVKEMISRQREKYGWEFIFLGANIDALETAERYGIKRERAINYKNDGVGIEESFLVMHQAISRVRDSYSLDDDCWKTLPRNDRN